MKLSSKELLSAVLEMEIIAIGENEVVTAGYSPIFNTYINAQTAEYPIVKINIYELMNLMKEWAYDNGYWIDSNLGFVSIGFHGTKEIKKTFNGYDLKLNEQELVTKACEWILEQQ